MIIDRLRYELKLAGKMLIVVPGTVILVIGLFAVLVHFLQQSPAHALLAGLEMFLPLAAGIVAATLVSQDAALELQLTMPRKYHITGLLRLLLIFCWTTCLAVFWLVGMLLLNMLYTPAFTQVWPQPVRVLTLQLLWFAPLLWFVAMGACLALLTQSRSASGALVGGLWLLNILFVSIFASIAWLRPILLFPATLIIYPATHVPAADFTTYWLTTRFELLAGALILLALDWLLLRDTERLLKGATEE
ncbi:MAG: hypothetical protein M3Y81_11330 [Chloroflexota bacterium]|nr:hypothetical protein [Chloroflexota bacterium]